MPGFLIEYNRRTSNRRVTRFDASRDALQQRLELEKGRDDPDVEIVSLVGESLDAIKRTHSRYFQGGLLSD